MRFRRLRLFVSAQQFIEIRKPRGKIVIEGCMMFIVESCPAVKWNPVEVTSQVVATVFKVGIQRAEDDPAITKNKISIRIAQS